MRVCGSSQIQIFKQNNISIQYLVLCQSGGGSQIGTLCILRRTCTVLYTVYMSGGIRGSTNREIVHTEEDIVIGGSLVEY